MIQSPQIGSDDFYERLGVAPSASREEIRRAYRQLIRQYPPERAPAEFKLVREAYETLGDEASREAYDARPDPHIEQWAQRAIAAMGTKDYATAEMYLKQVLLELPDLHYARNLLGLCHLYREDGPKAVAQYERLMQAGPMSATIYGNAGHAYLLNQQSAAAERAFETAIAAATSCGEDTVEYYIGLADANLQQNCTYLTRQVLERGIQHDGVIDFQDLRLFTKLLEIALIHGSQHEVRDVLARVCGIVEDAEQGRYVAWKLGSLTKVLVTVGRYDDASILADAATTLEPEDLDYKLLKVAVTAMQVGLYAHVLSLIELSNFQPGGWLADVTETLESACWEAGVFEPAELSSTTSDHEYDEDDICVRCGCSRAAIEHFDWACSDE